MTTAPKSLTFQLTCAEYERVAESPRIERTIDGQRYRMRRFWAQCCGRKIRGFITFDRVEPVSQG